MNRLRSINVAWSIYLLAFVLIVMGVIPRWFALVLGGGTFAWMLWVPLDDAVELFVCLIPFFIALPLTAHYDNLTLWRPISILLAIRFALVPGNISKLKLSRGMLLLFVFACLSLIPATHRLTGVIRIIYFINLSLVPVIVYSMVRQGTLKTERIIRAIALTTAAVVLVGFIQLASTYLIDIYQFMRLWGEGIQLREFGAQWSAIAVTVGNTWLAYYGNQLSLRVFSVFPDSHSFPTFVLLGIPALLAMTTGPVIARAKDVSRSLARIRGSLGVLWVPAAYLAAILSGTRGIWAASVGVALVALLVWWFMPRWHIDAERRRVFGYLASYLSLFFLLFAVAWPIFISPQFLIGKGNLDLFGNRIRSIIDFGETSNSQRLLIWKASLVSIAHHPFLGVGIGNFPIVLGQNIVLARAGSTAHNLYLHVAAEMGIIPALEVIVLLASAWLAAWYWFGHAKDGELAYSAMLLLYLPWVYLYVLTDPIVFDERVFLLFGVTLALAWAHQSHA